MRVFYESELEWVELYERVEKKEVRFMIKINRRNFLLKIYRHLKLIFLLQTFLDAASGASDDWAKSVGIKYAYTIELSPSDMS